jgi:hypothetical protein
VCASPVFTAASTCDGVGVCHASAPVNCGLYQCGAAGCKTTCAAATDCIASNVCINATCGAPTNLKLQYFCRALGATEQSPKPQFQIVNLAATPVPLSEITIRYWYTVDGVQPQSAAIDYAAVGGDNIIRTFVALPAARPMADFYLQLGFTAAAGALAGGGANSGQIQVRFNKADFSSYTQSNDYSFDATKIEFADWNRVTVYRNGILAWGIEPPGP